MPVDTHSGYALITGASSGIGEALTREYARRGAPLVLTARRLDRLEKLAAELRSLVPVETIPADLADPAAPAQLVVEIERRGVKLRILVNNAGYGVPGRYLTKEWPVHAQFLQVMIGAASELTWRVLPALRASANGRILNVASFAALVPGADGQTLYAAAKAYLVKFSESLSLENADRKVNVTVLCPGFTWSEFHDVTGTRGMMSKLQKWAWLQADDVASAGIEGVERGRVMVVPGRVYRLLHFTARPRGAWIDGQEFKEDPQGGLKRTQLRNYDFVIPAKAGIHLDLRCPSSTSNVKMDPSFRWDDGKILL